MESEDDVQPLIDYEGENRDIYFELTAQKLINIDPEFDQVRTKSLWL